MHNTSDNIGISVSHWLRNHSINIYLGIAVILGILFGLIILYIGDLPFRWVVSLLIILLIFVIALISKNPKKIFIFLFFIGLPVITMNYFNESRAMHYEGPAGYYHTFYDFALFVLYMLWISRSKKLKGTRVQISKLDYCFLGLIAMSFLSMINAYDQNLCLYAIFRMAVMYLIFLYMANSISLIYELKLIIKTVLFGLLCEGTIGILQYITGNSFGLALLGGNEQLMTFNSVSRVSGTLQHPNVMALYLGFFIPISISMLFAPISRGFKLLCALSASIAIAALFLTLSRGGWVTFIISIIILFLLLIKSKILTGSKFARVSSIVGTVIIILFIVFNNIIISRIFAFDYGAAKTRIPLMQDAINIIKDNPIFGIGINNYTKVQPQYATYLNDKSLNEILPVHNVYLLLAAEIGIIGLIVFIYFIIQIYKKAIINIHSNNPVIMCFTIGTISGLSAFLIHLTFDWRTIVSESFVYFWAFSGLLVGISRKSFYKMTK